MRIATSQGRLVACLGLVAVLAGCQLPRSGPYYSELVDEPPAGYDFEIIPVTPAVATITDLDERRGFDISFVEAGPVATHTIAPGDVLTVTVWENIDEGLLNPAGIGAAPLPNTKVDERGRVFVPYVGVIQAAGRTIGELRETIRASLAQKTLNPQVDVFPVDMTSRRVSVQGAVNTPGVYPIEDLTRQLLPMVAQAGGTNIDPEVVRVKVRRGRVQGEISLQELYDEPVNNIYLREGDAIIAERDRRIFTALGAVAAPSTVPFPTRDLSVVRALGTVGGLAENTADPTGIFVFRTEPVAVAQRLFPEKHLSRRLASLAPGTADRG